jgi:hypothetical protein
MKFVSARNEYWFLNAIAHLAFAMVQLDSTGFLLGHVSLQFLATSGTRAYGIGIGNRNPSNILIFGSGRSYDTLFDHSLTCKMGSDFNCCNSII